MILTVLFVYIKRLEAFHGIPNHCTGSELPLLSKKNQNFIATLVPVQTADAAIACIEEVRKANRKARHNVYAYILRENHMTRYSDDGEPQGTAGVPVLNVLQKQNLTDVIVVWSPVILAAFCWVAAVWYGQYSHSAGTGSGSSTDSDKNFLSSSDLKMAYSLYGKVSYQLPQLPILQQNADFGDTVTLSLLVPAGLTASFQADMIELTNGEISIQVGEQLDADFAEIADRIAAGTAVIRRKTTTRTPCMRRTMEGR